MCLFRRHCCRIAFLKSADFSFFKLFLKRLNSFTNVARNIFTRLRAFISPIGECEGTYVQLLTVISLQVLLQVGYIGFILLLHQIPLRLHRSAVWRKRRSEYLLRSGNPQPPRYLLLVGGGYTCIPLISNGMDQYHPSCFI